MAASSTGYLTLGNPIHQNISQISATQGAHVFAGIHVHNAAPNVPGFRTKAGPVFSVPFERHDLFVGRYDILQKLETTLDNHRRACLHGIGGVGKSQLAIQFCYQFRDAYPEGHVLWMHSSSAARLSQAYKDATMTLGLTGWDNPEINTVTLLNDWLSNVSAEHWLLVFDNVDNLDALVAETGSEVSKGPGNIARSILFPASTRGSILLTTRDRRVGEKLVRPQLYIAVPLMSIEEATNLVFTRIDQNQISEPTEVKRLVEDMSYLPLAITQATAFIHEYGATIKEYLAMLDGPDAEIDELLEQDYGDRWRDQESESSVFRTWRLSFEHIRSQKPQAAELLSLMSMLDRQGISRELQGSIFDRKLDLLTAIGTLQAFSLIEMEKDGSTCALHRLVQRATQRWVQLEGRADEWCGKALFAVSSVFPNGSYETWPTCQSLLPHVVVVIRYSTSDTEGLERLSSLLNRKAVFDLEQGRYNMAEDSAGDAYRMSKRVLGDEHPSTLTSMANLAATYRNQGRWKEAETLEVQVMESTKKVLGDEHPSTLTSMANLAATYSNQGRWKEAETLKVQVMESTKRVLGDEHPDTLTSMANLAATYWNQGRWKEAETLEVQVMESTLLWSQLSPPFDRRHTGGMQPYTALHQNSQLCRPL